MANAIYPKYKTAILTAGANTRLDQDTADDGPYCALIDTADEAYNAADEFYSDITGAGIVGTDQRITSPTVGSVADGVFDGANITYTAVTGDSVEALIIYRHNAGANTTWRLVAFIDTSVTGLPVTPNGGDITVTWNASGIFLISDRKMKENIREVGDLFGLVPIYEFNYHNHQKTYRGVMAQDVEKLVPAAVINFPTHKVVNYQKAFHGLAELAKKAA